MQPFILIPVLGNDPADEWVKLGGEAHVVGKSADAERHYRRAIALSPNHSAATCNLGILLAQTPGQLNEGILAFDRAALFDGVEPMIHANRALAYLEADRIEEGIASAEYAVSLAKELPPLNDALKVTGYMLSRLSYAMLAATSGNPTKAFPAYLEMLQVDPKHPAAGPNSCFVTSLMNVTPAELVQPRKLWYETHRFKGNVWPHGNDKTPDRPLRIGYVGGDFKSHSAAMMFSNVLLQHSPAVLPYFYSSLPVNHEADDMTQKFMFAAGHLKENPEDGPPILTPETSRWRDIVGKTDEEADDMIRKDKIDILVDLAGHTNGGRLGVFTRKPAPIAVTAWGFAHGTGCPDVDYFFADPVAIPEAERQHYAEKIVDLPSIVTYRPPAEYGLKPTSPLPYYSNDYITLGSFSRFEKLSDECLATFAEIMRRLPTSRLLLKDHAMRRPYSIRRVMKALDGIDKSRIRFGISTSHPEHLAFYQNCDLYLDTFPHGAGVVSLECLYQGVPLLTRYGPQPAGRTASSVLTAMGRTDWIAYSADEFVSKVVEWAGRTHELAAARRVLRDEFLACPVVAGYPAAVEASYKSMWAEYCKR